MDFQKQIIDKTDQELVDIYINSDQYQKEFVEQAHQELTKRGVTLDKYNEEISSKLRLTTELLKQERKGNEVFIILGLISAVLGGLFGIIAGYTYSQTKKSGPSGERYYVYDKKTRETGQIMMLVGIVVLVVTVIWNFS